MKYLRENILVLAKIAITVVMGFLILQAATSGDLILALHQRAFLTIANGDHA